MALGSNGNTRQRRIIVMKFGGTTTGSSPEDSGIKDARLLIERKLNEGYFVIPVFSAMRRPSGPQGSAIGITDTLLRYRSIIATEKLDGFINRLWIPHLELARALKLISQQIFMRACSRDFVSIQQGANEGGSEGRNDWPLIQTLWTEVGRFARRASTYYDEPPSASGLDALAVGGERLIVRIIAEYLNSKWKQTGFGFRAEPRTAKEVGILTDGNFGDANILRGTRYELIVLRQMMQDARRKIVPIVTGFDGIYKETGATIEHMIDVPERGEPLQDISEALEVVLDRAFRQPELRDCVVRRLGLTCFLDTRNRRKMGSLWNKHSVSAEVILEPPAKSADMALKDVRTKLLTLPEQAAGLRIDRLLVQLSGIQFDQGFTTTLGRGGSDLTATYIAKAVHAESVYLLKDTEGVETANPKIVPYARTLQVLPYELAVEAGNIQRKAVQPVREGNLPIEVFNPKHPDVRTVIGPFEIEDRLYLIPNPVTARMLSIRVPANWTPEHAIQEALKAVSMTGTLDLLELRYDSATVMLLLNEASDVEYVERYIQQQLGVQAHSELCHYLRVVGQATQENVDRFVTCISPFKPLVYPVGRSSAHALAAALPADVDINEVIRILHRSILLNHVTQEAKPK